MLKMQRKQFLNKPLICNFSNGRTKVTLIFGHLEGTVQQHYLDQAISY